MTLLQIFPHKNDEVTIVVSDVNARDSSSLDAADHNGRFSRNSTSRYPQKWSDVKASLIAANIFSISIIDGLETDLRTIKVASAVTDVSRSTISKIISNLPKA